MTVQKPVMTVQPVAGPQQSSLAGLHHPPLPYLLRNCWRWLRHKQLAAPVAALPQPVQPPAPQPLLPPRHVQQLRECAQRTVTWQALWSWLEVSSGCLSCWITTLKSGRTWPMRFSDRWVIENNRPVGIAGCILSHGRKISQCFGKDGTCVKGLSKTSDYLVVSSGWRKVIIFITQFEGAPAGQ